VIFTVSTNAWGSAHLYVESSDGSKVSLGDVGTYDMRVFYYYVQKSDFYYCLLHITSYSQQQGLTAVLNIEVTKNTPNLLFLFIGIIVLLAGAVTVPCAFLYKVHNEQGNKRAPTQKSLPGARGMMGEPQLGHFSDFASKGARIGVVGATASLGCVAARLAPHFKQKAASSGSWVPHLGDRTNSFHFITTIV
jgi:hypothetical protein